MVAFHSLSVHLVPHLAHPIPHHLVAHAGPRLSGRILLGGILLILIVRSLLLGRRNPGHAQDRCERDSCRKPSLTDVLHRDLQLVMFGGQFR